MEDNIFYRQKLQYLKKKYYRNKNLQSKPSLQQQKKCRKLFLHKQKFAVSNFFFSQKIAEEKN